MTGIQGHGYVFLSARRWKLVLPLSKNEAEVDATVGPVIPLLGPCVCCPKERVQ